MAAAIIHYKKLQDKRLLESKLDTYQSYRSKLTERLMMMKSNVSKLSSKDHEEKASLRYMFGAQLGWNYERMMNMAYVRVAYPALKSYTKMKKN